jgi:hypothetical protein
MRDKRHLFLFSLALAFSGLATTTATQQAVSGSPPVYVTLWFDTEDFTSPEADGIILPLCRILEKHGIQATFKLVGEKARDLERKGQKDVIQALSRQDIGFHTTYHSLPPAVTAYMERLEWSEGAEEFIRREEAGFNDTKRIFKRTTICYGQPGNAWAPQVYPALRHWGVPLYLDEGTHVGLKGKPFYYCGLLNVYDMADRSTRMNLEGEADYQKGIADFRRIHEKLTAEGGGLVSIYYHPNEFDHTEFWDAVIWSHGANPPKRQWKYPRKRTPESREQTLRYFSRYLDFMQSLPGVRFVTGTDMVKLYADKLPTMQFTGGKVRDLARPLVWEITFERIDDVYLSPAESFAVLLRWYLRKPGESSVLAIPGLLGPLRKEPAEPPGKVERWEFRKACEDTLEFMSRAGHVPPVIWIGSRPAAPGDFLATLASEVLEDSPGESVELRTGRLSVERYVAEESPGLFNWIIMPEGFRAPHVMELARLQCWSLKPAARDDASMGSPNSKR